MRSIFQRVTRLRTGLAGLLAIAMLAGCSAGTSDGGEVGGGQLTGGGGNTTPPPPPDDPAPPPPPGDEPTPILSMTATLSWGNASGPVAGYRVLVSRNDGPFSEETQTGTASVALSGMIGDVVRVRVAAFDAQGNMGPMSEPSDPFVFVGPQSSAAAASSASDASDSAAGGGSAARTLAAAGGSAARPSTSSNDSSGDAATSASRGDVFGAGVDDLVWQTRDASLVRVSSADLAEARVYALPAGGWRVVAVGDFDADGASDLLLAAQSSLALAPGTALRAGPGTLTLSAWADLPAGAAFAGSGDFDGDGAADAVVVAGTAASLYLAAGDVLELPAAAAGSLLVGVGDADGDGYGDLLWSGAEGLALWRLVGGAVADVTPVATPSGALVALADFDGDGADELALRTAANAISLERLLAPNQGWQEAAPPGAVLAGCGDYDGDGAPDRLWADSSSLRVVGAAGEQPVALDAASPWQLVHTCE